MKVIQTISGWATGANSIVPAFLKDHANKLSSKRIMTLGGGGYLLTQGVDLLCAAKTTQDACFFGGIACLASGTLIALFLSEKIKDVAVQAKERN